MKTPTTFRLLNTLHFQPDSRGRRKLRAGALSALLLGAASFGLVLTPHSHASPERSDPDHRVRTVFVIALENHNFTQPNPAGSPQQILGNPAAPFINSLLTPGNPNAAQVSYATAYYNAGVGVHPSEPNYVWAEAGTDFGIHTDADPSPANGNTSFDQAPHLTAQLNAAGISWRNYQEDIDLSVSPTNSASGTNGPVNPYNGTTQYNYAVKHNPMAFFTDTALENVYPLAQLFLDLAHHTVGRYNWITPDQYNDAHSSLHGGFTYQGVHYTGDQSSIAAADNFLSMVIPQIMASDAYQNNGAIILWWDESENGDDTSHTVPEIIISPLAKGNAYASSVPLNHSSDIKTIAELFALPALNNPIPTNEVDVTGTGYNNVALVNDLSDLFVPGAVPAAPAFSVEHSRLFQDRRTHHAFQFLRIINTGSAPVPAPLFLVLDNLSPNATLLNAQGETSVLAPLGSPYVIVPLDRDGAPDSDQDYLWPGQSVRAVLEFLDPSGTDISYDTRVLSVLPMP
jgi:hypothetical protein